MIMFSSNTEQVRAEIAAAAARMIAEDGVDYATAKKKAARQVLGSTKIRGEIMPDNGQIEEEVRIYNELFFADTQPARLLALRRCALRLMDELAEFKPHITGAVLNGTASAHSDVHLQLFVENAKDVEIFLLNRNIAFEVSESPRVSAAAVPAEILSFIWHGEGVHLAVYEADDVRGVPRTGPDGRPLRLGINGLRELLARSEQPE